LKDKLEMKKHSQSQKHLQLTEEKDWYKTLALKADQQLKSLQ
jgi:hypothetical protein